MSVFKRLPGVHLQHRKHTAEAAPVRMPIPKTVTLPMSMHIGAPAEPVVAVGDPVRVGQLIGRAGAGLSSPVYSGVSGTVKKLDEMIAVGGAHIRTVIIETDGLQTVSEEVAPPQFESREDFLAAVGRSGIVGLGGAGFPTPVKLGADPSQIEVVVINGAECEPYITSDTRTMLDQSHRIAEGIGYLQKYLAVPRVIIGIEKNKPHCLRAMTDATAALTGVEVKALPAVYPQGGEKVLVYHTTGRVIGEGKLPIDAGVIVINCTTLACIAEYLATGMPLVEKCVTVDGDAVAEPKNVIVPIGTRVMDLIDFCGGFSQPPRKILWGGPMMGIALSDLSAPVLKQTNAILAFGREEATPPKVTACIGCGRCENACPFGLAPAAIERAYRQKDGEAMEGLKVNLCMECGCCSYVCPAKRNLVQTNKLSKNLLREYQAKQTKRKGGAKS